MTPLSMSPPTRKGLRGIRSIHGAMNRGSRKPGISSVASTSAEAKVLPVSSNTKNDMGKAADDAAYGAQSAGGDQQGKIPCPESVFHRFSPREYHSTLVRR